MTKETRALILACQAVLQTQGGTNPAACAAAHGEALRNLAQALKAFMAKSI